MEKIMSKKIKKTIIQEIKDEYEVLNKYYEIYEILEENKEFLEIKINEDYQLNENTIQEIEKIIEINEKKREKYYDDFRDGGVEKSIDDECNDYILQQQLKDKNNLLENNINKYLKKIVSDIEQGDVIYKFMYNKISEDKYPEFTKKYKNRMEKLEIFNKLVEKIEEIRDIFIERRDVEGYNKFLWITNLGVYYLQEELVKRNKKLFEDYLIEIGKKNKELEEKSEKIVEKYENLEETSKKIVEKYENLKENYKNLEENYKNFNQKTLEIMGIFLMIFSLLGIGTTSILNIQDNIISKILVITGIIILGISVLFYFIKNSFESIRIPAGIGIAIIIFGVCLFYCKPTNKNYVKEEEVKLLEEKIKNLENKNQIIESKLDYEKRINQLEKDSISKK
jgi:hypothetical protein